MSAIAPTEPVNPNPNGGTPGVHFPDKFRSPVVALQVPIGIQVGTEVYATSSPNGAVVGEEGTGKTYGPYRIATVMTPGEGASITFALAYKVAKPKSARTVGGRTSAVADELAQTRAESAAALAAIAKVQEQNAQLLQMLMDERKNAKR